VEEQVEMFLLPSLPNLLRTHTSHVVFYVLKRGLCKPAVLLRSPELNWRKSLCLSEKKNTGSSSRRSKCQVESTFEEEE
jgi:hypothetical protein